MLYRVCHVCHIVNWCYCFPIASGCFYLSMFLFWLKHKKHTQWTACVICTSCRSGALNVAVRELLGHYMSLEEMYMYETANMAIKIDEVGCRGLNNDTCLALSAAQTAQLGEANPVPLFTRVLSSIDLILFRLAILLLTSLVNWKLLPLSIV